LIVPYFAAPQKDLRPFHLLYLLTSTLFSPGTCCPRQASSVVDYSKEETLQFLNTIAEGEHAGARPEEDEEEAAAGDASGGALRESNAGAVKARSKKSKGKQRATKKARTGAT
jgi:hypothetical protein